MGIDLVGQRPGPGFLHLRPDHAGFVQTDVEHFFPGEIVDDRETNVMNTNLDMLTHRLRERRHLDREARSTRDKSSEETYAGCSFDDLHFVGDEQNSLNTVDEGGVDDLLVIDDAQVSALRLKKQKVRCVSTGQQRSILCSIHRRVSVLMSKSFFGMREN